MPSESGEGRPSRVQQSMGHPPPPHTDPLPCPRCHSSNTKFCYYNNYNLSQPRHFCKACRRYWTQGGTLRDVPVGGGSRKNSKRRSRSSSSNSSTSCSPSSSSLTQETIIPSTPISLFAGGANPEAPSEDNNVVGNIGEFTSLLNSQLGPGFLALGGGYGSGLGHGFEEIGLGPLGYAGRGVWAFPEVGDFGSVNNGGASGCNTWQMMTGAEGGLVDGDCFAWPELEISMPGKGLK